MRYLSWYKFIQMSVAAQQVQEMFDFKEKKYCSEH